MKRIAAFVIALAMLPMTACASLGLPSSIGNEGMSPRASTVGAAATVIDVMDGLSDAGMVGLLPANFADDIVQFAPDVEKVATGYLDATAACIVIDGVLQSDPATGAACSKNALHRVFGNLSDLMRQAAIDAGVDTDAGRLIYVAWLALRNDLEPSSGDIVSGYAKTPDVPLDQFNAMRADLRAARDRLLVAAAANAKKK